MKNWIILFAFLTADLMLAVEATPTETACAGVKSLVPPKDDVPSPETIAQLKGCDSEALYYGIGKPIDYPAALGCAYAELQAGDELVFGGSAVLMMIYANGGLGKKRLDLALHFACQVSGAPAETEGRVSELVRRTKTPESKVFDLCDHTTSGFLMGHCTRRDSRLTDAKRDSKMQTAIANWNEAEKAAFEKLRKASDAFIEARGQNEVDLSGTARSAFVIAEEEILKKDFLQSLEKLENKTAPKYSEAQAKAEDKKLNRIYRKVITKKDGNLDAGTVTPEGIEKCQRAWLSYRNGWVEFAKVKYPNVSASVLLAWFTKKRNHMLRAFVK